jgi:CDP-diacylglycerol--serine O-phosphatidyltransferase
MILWGVLLDKLDGTSARLLKASSSIGAELDSFADFAVFGIAPAALVYFRIRGQGAGRDAVVLLAVACGVYVVANATRLARFNITTPPGGDRLFYGVPTTLCGAIVASGLLTWDKYAPGQPLPTATPIALVVLGVLMVSTLKLPKLKHRKSLALNVVQYANVAAAYVLGPLCLLPEYLFGLATVYALGGVVWCRLFPPAEASPSTPPKPLAT